MKVNKIQCPSREEIEKSFHGLMADAQKSRDIQRHILNCMLCQRRTKQWENDFDDD